MAKEGSVPNRKQRNILKFKQRLAQFKLLGILSLALFYSCSILIINAALDSIGVLILIFANLAIMLPIATILITIQAGLALREAQLKNWRPHPLIRALVETFNALVFFSLTIITCLFIANPSSAILSSLVSAMFPVIIISLAAKAIYHLSASIYYCNKEHIDENMEQQFKIDSKTLINLLSGLSFAFMAIIWTALCFYPLAITSAILTIGLAAGALAVAVASYQYVFSAADMPDSDNILVLPSNTKLYNNLEAHYDLKVDFRAKPSPRSSSLAFFTPSNIELKPEQEISKRLYYLI